MALRTGGVASALVGALDKSGIATGLKRTAPVACRKQNGTAGLELVSLDADLFCPSEHLTLRSSKISRIRNSDSAAAWLRVL